MQTITHGQEGATLMAQWRATGGAMDAAGREETSDDDGLAASGSTRFYCNGDDDGLAASGSTRFYCNGVDDGLSAREPSFSHMCI